MQTNKYINFKPPTYDRKQNLIRNLNIFPGHLFLVKTLKNTQNAENNKIFETSMKVLQEITYPQMSNYGEYIFRIITIISYRTRTIRSNLLSKLHLKWSFVIKTNFKKYTNFIQTSWKLRNSLQ